MKRRIDLLSPFERLDLLSMPCPATGCQLWLSTLDKDGYGRIRINYKRWLAHRLAWTLTNGPIPAGMCVCHKCDVRACINPGHLWLGTTQENTADRDAKGRNARIKGDGHWLARITRDQAARIREDGRVHRKIAAEYGISRQLVGLIKQHKAWSEGA